MRHVFVGDIHGKVEAVKEALARPGKKVFVGDIIDSYDRTVEEHKECYNLIFDAIDKGDAVACLGNHELSYLMPSPHECSGWEKWRASLMRHYGGMILEKFKPYILLAPDFLVTHAGLTNQIWENEKLTLDTLKPWLDNAYQDRYSPVHYIGYCRGGPNPFGGIFWATWKEDFEPIQELTQVFGHTRQKWGIQYEKHGDHTSYCIDCLDWHKNTFLELDL